MANMPSIYKTRVSLLLDNKVIVALDKKATQDGTSRNSVANYYLNDALRYLMSVFSAEDNNKVAEMAKKNSEARHG